MQILNERFVVIFAQLCKFNKKLIKTLRNIYETFPHTQVRNEKAKREKLKVKLT